VPEEEIQAGYNRFRSWIAGLSQPSKEHSDLWTKSSMDFGYHLRSIAARAHLSGSDRRYLQQKVRRLELSRNMGSLMTMNALAEALRNRWKSLFKKIRITM
jgi:hypothetical protein